MDEPEHRRLVVGTVSVVVPELELAKLEVGDGDTLLIGELTQGVFWSELMVGQRVECGVAGIHAVRVEYARVLD